MHNTWNKHCPTIRQNSMLQSPEANCLVHRTPHACYPGPILGLQSCQLLRATNPTPSVVGITHMSWCSLSVLRYLFSSSTRSLCVLTPSRFNRSSNCAKIPVSQNALHLPSTTACSPIVASPKKRTSNSPSSASSPRTSSPPRSYACAPRRPCPAAAHPHYCFPRPTRCASSNRCRPSYLLRRGRAGGRIARRLSLLGRRKKRLLLLSRRRWMVAASASSFSSSCRWGCRL